MLLLILRFKYLFVIVQISGIGSVFMMPVIGNLSDVYGRKLLLTFPLTFSIFPLLILGLRRTTVFFYVYYVLKTLTGMVTEGGVMCLALSFLADNGEKRVSAFGLLAGVESAAALFGTLAARLLPTTQIFQVAAVASITALVYMRIFLEDTTRSTDALEQQPILNSTNEEGNKPLKTTDIANKIPSPKDIIRLLKSSTTASLASFVAFFINIAQAAVVDFLMYYLKARFHFQKDQFADITLIIYSGAVISNMLLDSIAWSSWVSCIISKQVGPNEQGIAQGCIMGISAFASAVSPVIYSPISGALEFLRSYIETVAD
ncbi:UNVERIFIED_CONTAM: hypothetical protein Sradi_1438200 [Sesamum radiatum]|uniref:Major facilitator superfamily (MFS) profile domain-containing protein n=1 Tax=Sesamum radiatum TaxID=300843 RepID=A0AAW2U7Q8_SESRA